MYNAPFFITISNVECEVVDEYYRLEKVHECALRTPGIQEPGMQESSYSSRSSLGGLIITGLVVVVVEEHDMCC